MSYFLMLIICIFFFYTVLKEVFYSKTFIGFCSASTVFFLLLVVVLGTKVILDFVPPKMIVSMNFISVSIFLSPALYVYFTYMLIKIKINKTEDSFDVKRVNLYLNQLDIISKFVEASIGVVLAIALINSDDATETVYTLVPPVLFLAFFLYEKSIRRMCGINTNL